MRGDSVVPDRDRSRLPLQARLVVAALVDVVVQQLQDGVALLALEPYNVAGELAVDVERLITRDGMTAHDGVNICRRTLVSVAILTRSYPELTLDRLSADDTTTLARAREVGLLDSRVHGLERTQERNELRREPLESSYL